MRSRKQCQNKVPLVSVIVPSYNRPKMLRRAIESIENQTYDNIEIIVIDDGSSIDLREYVPETTFELTVARHEVNKGAGAARNSGIQIANGDYIAFLDSDDEWLPDKIEKQVTLLNGADQTIGAVYCSTYWQYNGYVREKKMEPRTGDIYSDLLSGWIQTITSTLLIRAECFEVCGGFDPEYPSFQEYDLSTRIAKQYKFDVVNEPLVIEHVHSEEKISSNPDKRRAGLKRFLQKWGDEMESVVGPGSKRVFYRRHSTPIPFMKSINSVQNRDFFTGLRHFSSYIHQSKSIGINDIGLFISTLLFAETGYNAAFRTYYRIKGMRRDEILDEPNRQRSQPNPV